MYDALVNIFQLIIDNIMNPIRDALNAKRIIQPIVDFLNNILNNFFRMFNNDNVLRYTINNELISAIIGLIVLVIIIEITYAIFKIVFTALEPIEIISIVLIISKGGRKEEDTRRNEINKINFKAI